MAKFLIQDIMPPDKRKRIAVQKHNSERETLEHNTAQNTAQTIQQERHQHESSHPHTTQRHSTIRHQASQDEMAPKENVAVVKNISERNALNYPEPTRLKRREVRNDEQEESGELRQNVSETDSLDAEEYTPETHDHEQYEKGSYGQYPYNERHIEPEYQKEQSRRNVALIVKGVFAVIACIALFVIGATILGDATVTVTPKQDAFTLENKQFRAVKTPNADALTYSVMQIDLTESAKVPATGQKTVTAKASGKIVVYNNYSDKSQRLIKNTRFQAPSGKIYRINESITVPGIQKTGTKSSPGSVEVMVYADEPGPEYNVENVDFTIPGFKGDPRFEKIYARSKTAISGGASGIMKSVADQDLSKAQDELRVALEAKLRSKAHANITDDQVAFQGGYVFEFGKPSLAQDRDNTENTATVEQKATLAVIVFKRDELARTIAKASVPGYSNEAVTIPDVDKLNFSSPKSTIKELIDANDLSFTLGGDVDLHYIVDISAIQKQVAGIDKKTFNGVVASLPMVDRAQASIKPFWRSHFPTNPSEITVVVKDSENSQ